MLASDLFQLGFDLLRNGALLVLGAMGYCHARGWLQSHLRPRGEQVLFGLAFGLLAVVSVHAGVQLPKGSILVDMHLAPIIVSTLIGGTEAGALTTIMYIVFWWYIGPPVPELGTLNALFAFTLSGVVGVFRRRKGVEATWRELLAVGIVVGVSGVAMVTWWPKELIPASLLVVDAPLWVALVTSMTAALGAIVLHFERARNLGATLQKKEREFAVILDNAPLAIFLKDRQGRYQLINRTYTEWFGDEPSELYGRTAAELYSPYIVEGSLERDRQVSESGTVAYWERPVESAKPNLEYVLEAKFPIRGETGDIVGLAGFIVDVTERKRSEQALRWSEERFRALIEHSNEILIVVRPDGTITYRGPSAAEGMGYRPSEVIGRNLLELVHPDHRETLASILRMLSTGHGQHATGRSRVRHKDGSWRHIAWSARNAMGIPGIDGIILNASDATEAQVLEERLLHAQKMEAVGQLAGGIAHDFNNILGAILGFAGFLMEDLPNGSRERGFAERIVKASDRGKQLVEQILAFSRRTGVERRTMELGQIVAETLDLIRGTLPASTRLEVAATTAALVAEVNAAQIGQVLANLVVNASDALSGKPGSVSVALTRIAPGHPDYAAFAIADDTGAARPIATEGSVLAGSLDADRSYARISVADTGGGIKPEILKRIFDPFFTTKERGRGTGLGLAIVHGVLMSYNGACRVSTSSGVGSEFAVYLPLSNAAPLATGRSLPLLRGRERILVVDDDVDMTDVLTIGLDRLGYEVVAVNDPAEALAAFAESPTWDVVISDQVMPATRGLALCGQLKAMQPSLCFILYTGYSEGVTEVTAHAAGADAYFLKPVSPEQLAAAIRRLMDARAGANPLRG